MGGANDFNNLATACYKCNTKKNNTGAARWERDHPAKPIKSKFEEPDGWDGFSSLFLLLTERYPAIRMQSETEWLEALK